MYDPQVGRFLSADLFVQAPHFSQSFNRYSYVFNNPLSYTDPSGYQTTCQATVCEEVKTFGYSDSGDSGGWMRSGSWNYHGMAEFDFGLTHVWGQTLIKSQENPLVLDFSQNTDRSMAVTMGMMEAVEAKEYKKLLRECMQSSMNGAGLSLAGRGGRMNDARRGRLNSSGTQQLLYTAGAAGIIGVVACVIAEPCGYVLGMGMFIESGDPASLVGGSGPAKGFLEVSSSFKSSKAVQNLSTSKPIDFIFDPQSQRFIMGRNSLGHDGIRMAGGITHKDIVGGSIWRQNGRLMTDQSSGHYGTNWTPAIREQFTTFMGSHGVDVSHSATYRK